MPSHVVPEGLAGASASLEALTARIAAANAAAPLITAVAESGVGYAGRDAAAASSYPFRAAWL